MNLVELDQALRKLRLSGRPTSSKPACSRPYDATSTKGTSSPHGPRRARHITCPC